jgi:hypothetical protein
MINAVPRRSGVSVELQGNLADTTASLSRVASVGRQARVIPSPNGLLLIGRRLDYSSARSNDRGVVFVRQTSGSHARLVPMASGNAVIEIKTAFCMSALHGACCPALSCTSRNGGRSRQVTGPSGHPQLAVAPND